MQAFFSLSHSFLLCSPLAGLFQSFHPLRPLIHSIFSLFCCGHPLLHFHYLHCLLQLWTFCLVLFNYFHFHKVSFCSGIVFQISLNRTFGHSLSFLKQPEFFIRYMAKFHFFEFACWRIVCDLLIITSFLDCSCSWVGLHFCSCL